MLESWHMEYYSELRLRGDDYNDNFGNGMTLTGRSSVKGMSVAEQNDDETVFLTAKGHTLRCIHRRRGNVTDCRTVFENTIDDKSPFSCADIFLFP